MKSAHRVMVTALLVVGIGLAGCQSAPEDPNESLQSGKGHMNPAPAMEDLQIVDCSLPGQVRFLGNTSYLTPRRPTRTTASDCRIRGGEYVAYDRADYKTALAVWMPAAENGDAEAQANVGEIFERGLGSTPNHEAAVIWYTKAAQQGNKKAQFNLGTLYEQGLGVQKDPLAAMNWYRKAWEIPDDDIVLGSVMQRQIDETRQQMTLQLEKKDQQIRVLEKQVSALKKTASKNSELQQQLSGLQDLLADLRKERETVATNVPANKLREPASSVTSAQSVTPAIISRDTLNFGRYFALVIGAQGYQKIEPLQTPVNDAKAIAQVLEQKYGFAVTVLLDADNIAIMEAINNLNSLLQPDDNLLIYYAGHGSRTKVGNQENGYWLPINADAPPRDTYWITNEFITRHLGRLSARRVLLIADSCYAGVLSNDPGYLLFGNEAAPNANYMKYKLPRRSRLLLTSGGDAPVLDNGGGSNSVFARALIDVLESGKDILTAPALFAEIRHRVETSASALKFQQTPSFKAIKEAGHEVGDFFFVPVDSKTKAQSDGRNFKENLHASTLAAH